ncbi:MAG: hypothetical protein ABL993_16205 [Vicinamibacterales bacterium]
MGPVFSLSVHASYRCRHSGVCCSSDWDVPVGLTVYKSLDEALRMGSLQAAAGGGPPLITEGVPEDEAAMVARTASGDCVFYHRSSGLCVIHRDLGAAELPSTCRHFPRLAVRDARGTFISLTHYCPTAAACLFESEAPIQIVASPPAFPPGDYDGLHVEPDAWPPLLHPRMLMDLDGYTAWEYHMVSRCAEPGTSPETVLATLERDARRLRTFTPGDSTLAKAVAALPRSHVDGLAHATLEASLAHHAQVMAAVPEELKPERDEVGLAESYRRLVAPEWGTWHRPLTRYIAAKAFANWTAYQGRGILSIVRGLDAALALVRVEAARQCRDARRVLDAGLLREAIRGADFALNHLAVGEELASAWSEVEDAANLNTSEPEHERRTENPEG